MWCCGLGSVDYVELLRRRSKAYYEYSRGAFERGDYDIAIFMIEQALQLYIKSMILRILGYTPRTHMIRELLAALAKALSSLNKNLLASRIKDFVEENRDALKLIEEAYTGSRYLYKVYEREDVEKLLSIAEKLINLLEDVEHELFAA